jgi:hypothetical protein
VFRRCAKSCGREESGTAGKESRRFRRNAKVPEAPIVANFAGIFASQMKNSREVVGTLCGAPAHATSAANPVAVEGITH